MRRAWVLAAALGGCPGPTLDTVDTDVDTEPDTEAPAPWPDRLSQTGLYADFDNRVLAEGVRIYEPAWPLWSDGAEKTRYLWLPPGTAIDATDPDYFEFPVGTKAWKDFTRDGVIAETRYIERTQEGWVYVTYAWSDDDSDAYPAPGGVDNARGTPHDIPPDNTCSTCHMATGLLGVGAIQLGDDNPNGTLAAWTAEGLVTPPVEESTAIPGDGDARSALGYLHGNCGSCHTDRHFLEPILQMRLRSEVGAATLQDSLVYQTALGTPTRHELQTNVVIVPGDPDASQVVERMGSIDNLRMPPMGTEDVDEPALAVVRRWIESMETGE